MNQGLNLIPFYSELSFMKTIYMAIIIFSLGFWVEFARAASIKIHVPEAVEFENLAEHSTVTYPSKSLIETEINQPTLVHIKNRLPVLLLPLKENEMLFQLDSPLIKEVVKGQSQDQANNDLSEVLPEIFQIQDFVKRREFEQAAKRLDLLEAHYPRISSIGFIRASLLFLMGKKKEAREILEKLVPVFPNYQGAKDFLDSLRGTK